MAKNDMTPEQIADYNRQAKDAWSEEDVAYLYRQWADEQMGEAPRPKKKRKKADMLTKEQWTEKYPTGPAYGEMPKTREEFLGLPPQMPQAAQEYAQPAPPTENPYGNTMSIGKNFQPSKIYPYEDGTVQVTPDGRWIVMDKEGNIIHRLE